MAYSTYATSGADILKAALVKNFWISIKVWVKFWFWRLFLFLNILAIP